IRAAPVANRGRGLDLGATVFIGDLFCTDRIVAAACLYKKASGVHAQRPHPNQANSPLLCRERGILLGGLELAYRNRDAVRRLGARSFAPDGTLSPSRQPSDLADAGMGCSRAYLGRLDCCVAGHRSPSHDNAPLAAALCCWRRGRLLSL